jgi:hypothetical protein
MTKKGTTTNIKKYGKSTRENKKKRLNLLARSRDIKKQRVITHRQVVETLEYAVAAGPRQTYLIKKHISMPKPIYKE